MTVLDGTIKRSFVTTETLVKETAMAVSFGVVYFIMCVMNPLAGLTGVAGLISANIRWANLLRAFALVSPGSIVGIGMANTAFHWYSGKAIFGSYMVTNLLCIAVGFGIYYASKKIGRGYKKDIALLAIYGFTLGVITKFNLILIAIMFEGESIGLLFESAAWTKIGISTLLFVAGYPLLMLVRRLQNDKHEQGSSIK